jgi:hypothetical protein
MRAISPTGGDARRPWTTTGGSEAPIGGLSIERPRMAWPPLRREHGS